MAEGEVDLIKPGSVVNGRWEIVRRLKIGGMGAVYEVRDRQVGKRRALKVMLASLVTPAMLVRFRQEATLPGKINSDNVVDIHETGVDDERGLPFLVMEFLQGEDLGSRLTRGSLSAEEALFCLHGVSVALDCAHAADVVHRDLKPENVFVTRRNDGSGVEGIKVLDFGIAKIVQDSSNPKTTLILGTPLYMSPEQIMGDKHIGPKSDIYALGHLAFTLLTGAAYWEPEFAALPVTPFTMRVAQGAREPACFRAERKGTMLPSAFDAWFKKATAVSPFERHDSASELVEDLADVLGVRIPRPTRHSWASNQALTSTPPATRSAAPPARRRAASASQRTTGTGGLASSARRKSERQSLGLWLLVATLLGFGAAGYAFVRQNPAGQRAAMSTQSSDAKHQMVALDERVAPVTVAPAASLAPLAPPASSPPGPPFREPKARVTGPATRVVATPNHAAADSEGDPLEKR